MNYVLIGNGEGAGDFIVEADARRYRLLATINLGNPLADEVNLSSNPPHYDTYEEFVSNTNEQIDFILIADSFENRTNLLKQYTRNPKCNKLVIAAPVAADARITYEASLTIQEDRFVLFPLINEYKHPVMERIDAIRSTLENDRIRMIQWSLPIDPNCESVDRFSEGWYFTRHWIGELDRISATSSANESFQNAPVIVTGESVDGAVYSFQWDASIKHPSFQLSTNEVKFECRFTEGLEGNAELETVFKDGSSDSETLTPPSIGCRWLDGWEDLTDQMNPEIWTVADRQVEWAQTVEQSLTKQKTIQLSYEDISEQAAFRSVMASVGCSFVWIILLVIIPMIALQVPGTPYFILGILILFLMLQLFGLGMSKTSDRKETIPTEA